MVFHVPGNIMWRCNHAVGKLRVDIIKDVLEKEMGFRVVPNPVTQNKADVKVYHYFNLLVVMEVQNWKRQHNNSINY